MSGFDKQMLYGAEARSKVIEGVDKVANAVKVTLGPSGRNVMIERKYDTPYITKDGVTVAKNIYLRDNVMNMGAQHVKGVAGKTAEEAGDGTTTATVLAQAMIHKGVKLLEAGTNPMLLKEGMEIAMGYIVEHLRAVSIPIADDLDRLRQVALVSANGDDSIAHLIIDALKDIGVDGMIQVDDSMSSKSSVNVVKGLQFNRGLISPLFINNQNTISADFTDPYILVSEQKISDIEPLFPIFEKVFKESRSIVIIAPDVDGSAMQNILLNVQKHQAPILVVQGPDYGEYQKESLLDIATFVGATLVSHTTGVLLKDLTIEHLGTCSRLVCGMKDTTIFSGAGSPEKIEERLSLVENLLKDAVAEVDKERLHLRKQRLQARLAVIMVGGNGEAEVLEKKDRIDDAIRATQAAVAEGIVPGGGCAYLHSLSSLGMIGTIENETILQGIDIVAESVKVPFTQILLNAGFSLPDVNKMLSDVVKHKDLNYGFNARVKKYGDMISMGIVDPAKVTRVALEHAVSVASLLITMECVIAHEPDVVTQENK